MSTIAHLSDYRRREEEHDAALLVARVNAILAILNEMEPAQRIAAADAIVEAVRDGEGME